MRLRCIATFSLAIAVAVPPPRLFAVENWEKTEGGGPLPILTWRSWRLVEIDAEKGTLTGVTSWKGGMLPNSGDSNGLLVGAGWNSDKEVRDQLLVREGNGITLKCYAASTRRACSDIASPMSDYLEENAGFFTSMSMDDVEPFNTVFSLYDALSLASPSHIATINNGKTTCGLWMAQNWGINAVQQVIYVAAQPCEFDHGATARFYRVSRISGAVEELNFPPIKNASLGVSALFVDPAASGEKLLVLLAAESYEASSRMYQLDVTTGHVEVVLDLPGVNIGEAASHCKAFDKATGTLFLGCDPVTAVSLAERKVIRTTPVQKSVTNRRSGGSYSIGGIVALAGSPAKAIELV